MKYNMLIKQILLYIVVAITSFTAVTTICYRYDYNRIYNYYSNNLYQQATEISVEYGTDFLASNRMPAIRTNLNILSHLNNTRIMFIEPEGKVLLDTGYTHKASKEDCLYEVEDFDYGILNGEHSHLGNFFGLFNENMLSVYSPITSDFSIVGYVVINLPESVLTDRVYQTFNTNYLTLAISMILSLSMLILYFVYIHAPINELTKATIEYGKGNLSYRIQSKHNDEIGRLAASLDYMAQELNEMDKFQQKFLSNISHDFRSPLTSIKGYLEAIEDGTIPAEMINKYINI